MNMTPHILLCGEPRQFPNYESALTAAGAEWVAVAGLAASRQNQSLPARPGQPFDLDDAPGEAEDFV